jgi:hypothetical protein
VFTRSSLRRTEKIPWVRFHKTLTAYPGSAARTVFVVNAAELPAFLDEVSRVQGLGPRSRDLRASTTPASGHPWLRTNRVLRVMLETR